MQSILKYPRTQHIEGSKLQPGDEDLRQVPFSDLKGKHLVVEEKLDGANCGISFSEDGELRLQSRGHYLTGGPRERQFDLLKSWSRVQEDALRDVLDTRFIMYGEWLFARHTLTYDRLPHFFMEFDLFDREGDCFLSTVERRSILSGSPVLSAPVLHEGALKTKEALTDMVGPSPFRSGEDNLMEGLYIKVEEEGVVKERYKFVRHGFFMEVMDSETHWMNRPIEPNSLAEGVDIFSGAKP